MKHFFIKIASFFLAGVFFTASGCGYTQKTILPKNIKSIHVETVKNDIPISEVYAYQPGLEIDITNAIIRRLHQDGNLRVADREQADAILETHLVGFEQEGVRFNQLERVSEYRMHIILAIRLIDAKTKSVIWEEPNFSGDAEYAIVNIPSIPREEASQRSMDRLARNVVDRIVQDW